MSTPYTPRRTSSFKVVNPGSGSDSFSTESNQSRTLPRQLSTGSTRGTQTVGYGNTKIDGTNNTITIASPNGTIGMGAIPGSTTNEYGFFTLDANGRLVQKIIGGTTYVYDPSHNYINIVQLGLLPDGSGGVVAAKPGVSVDELFI